MAVVVLTVGSAATVMAEGEATPPEAGAKCLPARVAQILGISLEDLTNACEQVQQRHAYGWHNSARYRLK